MGACPGKEDRAEILSNGSESHLSPSALSKAKPLLHRSSVAALRLPSTASVAHPPPTMPISSAGTAP
jgi:hypothetical protein